MMDEGHIQDQLSCLPPHHAPAVSRCLKSMGLAGFPLWRHWYPGEDAMAVWDNAVPLSAFNLRFLESLSRRHGYRRVGEKPRNQQTDYSTAQLQTGKRAMDYVKRCKMGPSDYLVSKGFISEERRYGPPGVEGQGLVDSRGHLVIPMYSLIGDKPLAYQIIDGKGKKLFQPSGCRTRLAVHRMGQRTRPRAVWLVEGYATALSIKKALWALYRRRDMIIVCFSAGNLVAVAFALEKAQAPRFVIADNDKSGVGEAAAILSGLPYWMPPKQGMDANDWERTFGVENMTDELQTMTGQK